MGDSVFFFDAINQNFGRYRTNPWTLSHWALSSYMGDSVFFFDAINQNFGRYRTNHAIWALSSYMGDSVFFFDAINQNFGRYRTNPWTLSPYDFGRYHIT